jgi:DNA-directed RNA polymerase specialized sigma subunit
MNIEAAIGEQGAQAVRSAMVAMGRRQHPAFSRDDMIQVGTIGVWLAQRDLDRTRPAPEQQAWLAQRALNAIKEALRQLDGRAGGRRSDFGGLE